MPDENAPRTDKEIALNEADATKLARVLAAEGTPEKSVLLQGLRPEEIIRFAQQAGFSFSDQEIVDLLLASIDKYGGSRAASDVVPDPEATPYLEVMDYVELGRLVANWSVDPPSRPHDIVEIRMQLNGVAQVSEEIKAVEFLQAAPDRLTVVLPAAEMILRMFDRISDPLSEGGYPLPAFYSDLFRPGMGPVMTPMEMLLARIGERANIGRV